MKPKVKMVNVKTENGKFVHRARRLDIRGAFRYEILCNRASRWHIYQETRERADCPHCAKREAA
jgi:hypothetical protein